MSLLSSHGLESIVLAAAQLEAEKELSNVNIKTECDSAIVTVDYATNDVSSTRYPKAIININENDVLCGRGGETNHHPGNLQYRRLVKMHQLAYLEAKRRDKPRIAKTIVDQIRNQKPSGRFLKKINYVDKLMWQDVGDVKAREKTSQALREGAPVIRDSLNSKQTPHCALDNASSNLTYTGSNVNKFVHGIDTQGMSPPCILPRQVSDSSEEFHALLNQQDEPFTCDKKKRNSHIFDDVKGIWNPSNQYKQQRSQNEHVQAYNNTKISEFHSNIYQNKNNHLYGMRFHLSESRKKCFRGPRIRIIKTRMRREHSIQEKGNFSTPITLTR